MCYIPNQNCEYYTHTGEHCLTKILAKTSPKPMTLFCRTLHTPAKNFLLIE